MRTVSETSHLPNRPPTNIFLVGLMGAGKTSVGRLLARRLNKTFYDSDHEIERGTGVRIPLIFDIEGESGFRERESKLLADLVKQENIVLATGGGTVISEANRRALAAHGTVVYLRASAKDLWQRTRHDKNRPLLQTENPLAKLKELFKHRDPLFREFADIVIDTGSQSLTSLVHQLELKLSQLKSGPASAPDDALHTG
jgi:shikimate kinase